jgi:hypothetical protein
MPSESLLTCIKPTSIELSGRIFQVIWQTTFGRGWQQWIDTKIFKSHFEISVNEGFSEPHNDLQYFP